MIIIIIFQLKFILKFLYFLICISRQAKVCVHKKKWAIFWKIVDTISSVTIDNSTVNLNNLTLQTQFPQQMSFYLMMKQRWSQKGRRLGSWKLKHSRNDLVNAENTRFTCFHNLQKKTIQEATKFRTFYTDESQLNISNQADFLGVKTDNNSFKWDKQLAKLSLAKILFLIRRPLILLEEPRHLQSHQPYSIQQCSGD